MKLEEQVCSLGLAKRLKELGVKQESLFYWSSALSKDNSDYRLIYYTDYSNPNVPADYLQDLLEDESDEVVAAFTVSELGEELNHLDINWYSSPNVCHQSFYEIEFQADTEAEARAKMLIYLLENKLIK